MVTVSLLTLSCHSLQYSASFPDTTSYRPSCYSLFIHTDLWGTQPPPGSSAQSPLPFPSPWHGCPLPYRSDLCSYATFSITSPCFLFFRALNSLRINLVFSLSSCFSLPLPRELHKNRNFTILWIFCLFCFEKCLCTLF